MYEKWSPSNPSYVKNFKTPTLVTQGEIDYRVPVGQSQQLIHRASGTESAFETDPIPR